MNLGLYWYYSRHPAAYKLVNFPLVALALLGLGLGAWRRVETQVMTLFSLCLYLSYAAILACARYSLQIMPFVTLLAAAAVVDLVRRASLARTKGAVGERRGPGGSEAV